MTNKRLFDRFGSILALILLFLLIFPGLPEAQEPPVEFEISMERPWNHYFSVEMKVKEVPDGGIMDLIMPVWIPGSYKIREFPQYVINEKAVDGAGIELKWEKTAKNRWRIYTCETKEVVFSYQVFAFVKSIRHSYLDDFRAVINGPHMFMFPEDHKYHPVKVKIIPYKDFKKITTGLRQDTDDPFTAYAEDFDQLFDCPIEIGNQDVIKFDVQGVPHYISISGSEKYDGDIIIKYTRPVVEEIIRMFGDIPYEKYVFFMAMDYSGGGLEHSNSTFLALRSRNYSTDSQVKNIHGLITHEFFHTWNVKRIRPFALGPFDYSRENYTRSLWIAEGITVYYTDKILYRAGFQTDEQYLDNWSTRIKNYLQNPGRFFQSAEESSFDAWTKHYLEHEDSENTTISYYSLGAFLGCMLDLTIIEASGGAKSLDDILTYLYEYYHKKLGRGFKPNEFQEACELMAGKNLDDFFEDHVRGRIEPDYNKILNFAGLDLDITSGSEANAPYLGVSLSRVRGRPGISFIRYDSPAYNQGLSINDQILSVNSVKVKSVTDLISKINGITPGETVKFEVQRDHRKLIIPVTIDEKDNRIFKITRLTEPTEEQNVVYKKWLGGARN